MALLKRKRALNDPMSVVTRFVNACNRHDADGVASCLHPDFDSIQPMFPSRNFRGADQVRRNWQAIFDAEPGFRLTVLRSAAMDDTVWLELHGAGREAEVAGVFVMGIQGDRIRWARIYSALVEPAPAGTEDPTAGSTTLHEVLPLDERPAADNGEVVDEAPIAPVVDIERTGRRRRRSARRRSEEGGSEAEVPVAGEPVAEEPVAEEPVAEEPVAEPGTQVVVEPEPEPEVVAVVVEEERQGPEPTPEVLVRPDSEGQPEPQPEPQPEVVAESEVPEAAAEPVLDAEDELWSRVEAPAADEPPPVADQPTKRRFGKRGR